MAVIAGASLGVAIGCAVILVLALIGGILEWKATRP
jgi:phage tail tape-measure protein